MSHVVTNLSQLPGEGLDIDENEIHNSCLGNFSVGELADMVMCTLKPLDVNSIAFEFRHRAIVQWTLTHFPNWRPPPIQSIYEKRSDKPSEQEPDRKRRLISALNFLSQNTNLRAQMSSTLSSNVTRISTDFNNIIEDDTFNDPFPAFVPSSPISYQVSSEQGKKTEFLGYKAPSTALDRKARLAASIFGVKTSSGAVPMQQYESDVDVDGKLGKRLTWLLRHGALESGLNISDDGYIPLVDILMRPDFNTVTIEDIERIVSKDSKKRYSLKVEDGIYYICANQGHSFEVSNAQLERITNVDQVSVCIHGTFYKSWREIQRLGLCRMNRQHIHFASEAPDASGNIPGMRNGAELLIHLNVEKCLKDGMELYKSKNCVILTPGINGYIPPVYFKYVEDARTHTLLNFKKN